MTLFRLKALNILLVCWTVSYGACTDSRNNHTAGGRGGKGTDASAQAGNREAGVSGKRAESDTAGSLAGASGRGGARVNAGRGSTSSGGASSATGGTVNGASGSGGAGSTSAGPVIGDCAVFPPDNPWNTRVDDANAFPTDPNSAAILQNIKEHAVNNSEHNLHADFGSNFGIPYVVVPATQPSVPISFNQSSDESDPGPFPIPLNAPVESGSDAHVLVLQGGSCVLFELYAAAPAGAGFSCDSAAKYDLSTNAIRAVPGVSCPTSADAAGLPIFVGLVKYEEVASGRIAHAVRFTLRATRRAFVRPATHYASSNLEADFPPMGMRVRLKAVPSGITGQALVVATALAQYGMILADNGSNWFISGAPDSRFDDNDLNQLKKIPETDFEVVTMGRLYTPSDCP